MYNKNFYLINFNYFLKTKIKKFKKIVKIYFSRNSFLKKTVIVYKILKLALSSVVYKDSSLLVYIIKKVFESVHYSQHRVHFLYWKTVIKKFLSKYCKKLNVFGIRLEFHGKLGVGGNSKKRSLYLTWGRCSNSSKLFKVDSTNSFFKTDTGVVGFTYSIFY